MPFESTKTVLTFLLLAVAPAVAAAALATNAGAQHFNLTAISAVNGKSTLECWQLAHPITVSDDAGSAGTALQELGDVSNASYIVIPPKFNGGLHNAPAAQYVVFLSGLAHVTLPGLEGEAWIKGGPNGLIIAADTAAVSKKGHITKYPGDTSTTALQIPLKGGTLPAHKVLHQGPCRKCEKMLSSETG